MKKSLLRLFALLASSYPLCCLAQTGPGGVGNSSTNKVWLDADKLTGLSNGGKLSQWTDVSGNGWHAAQPTTANQPTYLTNALNDRPVIHFDRSVATQFLAITSPGIGSVMNNSNSIFAVAKTTSGGVNNINEVSQAIFTAPGYHTGLQFTGHPHTSAFYFSQWLGSSSPNTTVPSTLLTSLPTITQGFWWLAGKLTTETATTTTVSAYLNSTLSETKSASVLMTNYMNDVVRIGAANASGSHTWALNGDIAEIILFNTALNDAQRIIIENYLSAKYNLAITNKYYTDNSNYNQEVQGIGTTNGVAKHIQAANSKGLLLAEVNNSLNATDEFLFTGHNSATNALVTGDIAGTTVERWQRDWYLQKTGSMDARLSFDFSDAGLTSTTDLNADEYVLLYRSALSDPFQIVTTAQGIQTALLENGDQLAFTLSNETLLNGYYTVGKVTGLMWTGKVSTDWNNSANWSKNTVPTAATKVFVPFCSTCPLLPANATISSLAITAGKLSLSGNTLEVTEGVSLQEATLNSEGGKLQAENYWEVHKCIFSGSTTLEKTGGTSNQWKGGNRFNLQVKLVNQSTATIFLAVEETDQVLP